MEVSVSKEVNAPREVVFAKSLDIANADQFIPAIEKIEPLSDGPVREGWRWRETRKMFGKEATEVMWFSKIDSPQHYVVEAESHGTHYWTNVTFEALDPNRTRITMTFTSKPLTMFAKCFVLLAWLMKGTVIKCFDADLEAVKASCEGTAAAA